MRPKFLGLAVALLVAAMAPAAAVISAPKEAPKVTEAQRKQGMAEAPALAQAAGLNCQVSDARFVGKVAGDKKKGTPESSFYEVACAPGAMGFVLQSTVGGPTTAFTCLEANFTPDGKPSSLPCVLPGNSDPKAVLAPMLQKAGAQCTPTSARGIGRTTNQTFIEVACQEGPGFIAIAPAPFDSSKPIQAQNCLNYDDANGNIKCTLSDKASRLAIVDRLATAAKNNCAIKDRRFVGTSKEGADFYEASCADGKGYVFKATGSNLVQTWDCAHAEGILGGCQLTDARQAATQEAALYTKLAKNSGADCAVTKYALFPQRGNDEVVELVCGTGNSMVGIFPPTGKGQVLDCGHALVAGYKCSLGKADYSALTADLQKFNAKSCAVSNARPAAKTTKGTVLVEVACADGLPGYMVEYTPNPVTAVGATGCRFTGNCQLPGNKTS